LPLLIGVVVLAAILANKKGAGRRSNAALGTAPAGAPPMRERDPATPSVRTNPLLERPAPYATPGTTAGAMAGAEGAAVGLVATRQPAPIAEADAPGTAAPEQLAEAGPDLAAWASDLVGDTDAAGAEETAGAAAGQEGERVIPLRTERAEGDASRSDEIPAPAANSTAIADEGEGWIRAVGAKSCPPEFPIKGNANSRIYHLPGESTYEATVPELCFATEEAAIGQGYRARKR
jgi:hypothetical protein